MGVQAQGAWVGRRQLFVKFAGEAETATMYSADALAREMSRNVTFSEACFTRFRLPAATPSPTPSSSAAALTKAQIPLPVMLDVDGQRPDELTLIAQHIALVQVTLDPGAADTMLQRGCATLSGAARAGRAHALVIAATTETSDAQILRTVEQVRDASAETDVILLPPTAASPSSIAGGPFCSTRQCNCTPAQRLGRAFCARRACAR